MKITIFQSGKGDSLLVSGTKTNILVDGGVSAAYNMHIAKALNKLQKKNIAIDLACVSHIDDDHIGGFLKMIEDLVDWRVFEFKKKEGDTKIKPPKIPRPAEIKEIWHNAFHDVVGKNSGPIEDMLAASGNILSASTNPLLKEMGEIALSKGQAIALSRRLRPDQLNIPLNKRFGGKLVRIENGKNSSIKVGEFTLRMIAPFDADLEKLRKEWNGWLKENKAVVGKIKEKVDRDKVFLESNVVPGIAQLQMMAKEIELEVLAKLPIDTAAKKLGVRKNVTSPNLASIMFLLEEKGKTLLMTGDGHWEDILKGLTIIKRLKPGKGLHLNALKVQHHGSEHNLNEEFCDTITADHYIFCGNGKHQNPDLDVVAAIINSRTTKPAKTAEAKKPFTLWFNTNSKDTEGSKTHVAKIEKLVKDRAAKFKNVKYKFIPEGKSEMVLTL
nr:MBL fold metallo-hydrolase [uncultured Sediminibacterium sp.]